MGPEMFEETLFLFVFMTVTIAAFQTLSYFRIKDVLRRLDQIIENQKKA